MTVACLFSTSFIALLLRFLKGTSDSCRTLRILALLHIRRVLFIVCDDIRQCILGNYK
ncbi:TPA: hypothetical protein N0F65_012008 [Lagenidium giganteum]|uniref:Uncharacterized protein n=1 Tax=Lagenidium giganteum TaxID=4803 RepID=A0AAV2Z5K4_9STRA|nr:TPA: hypothetical protein N0F65_012008 [Lagenidium giganteum]